MNFTREPIIETVITPRDGCKLVIKNSKCPSQEEYYVDAIEIVSFGQALFFRSTERPKSFFVPVSDYEVIEARETRMILKAAPTDKGIKIGGGRESKRQKEDLIEEFEESEMALAQEAAEPAVEVRDKKRERRKNRRKKLKGDDKEEAITPESDLSLDDLSESYQDDPQEDMPYKTPSKEINESAAASLFPSLLPPPTSLISETLSTYKGNAEYRKAFFDEEKEDTLPNPLEEEVNLQDDEEPFFPPNFQDD